MEALKKIDRRMTTQARFEKVFAGATYISSTFFRHQATWKNSTWQEREDAQRRFRNKEGCWDEFYPTASGWPKNRKS